MFNKNKTLLFACVLAMGMVAKAQTAVITVKAWTLYDYSTAAQPNASCILTTAMKKNNVIYSLDFMRAKNKPSATEIILRQTGAAEATVTGWQFKMEENPNKLMTMANFAQTGDTKFFWTLPNTDFVVKALIAKRDALMVSKGGAKEVKFEFESSGFDKAWAAMQNTCGAGLDISNAGFEKEFIINPNRVVDPLKLNANLMSQLRSLNAEGHQAYSVRVQKQTEMQKLRAQYQGLLDQYEPLESEANQIANKDLPSLRQQQSANDNQQANAESELKQVNANIPKYEAELKQLEVNLNKAKQVIAPYEKDHENYVDGLRVAQNNLDSSEARLASINSSISRTESRIRDLENELRQVERDVQDARYRYDSARREYDQADYEYRRFNVNEEERRILSNDYEYQRARQELPSAQSSYNQAQNQYNNANVAYNQANQELYQCQNAGGDCTVQQNKVNARYSEMQQANNNMQQARNRINQINNTISRSESRARNEARNTQMRLERRVSEARREVDRLDSIIRNGEQRSRDIKVVELPSNRSQLDRLQRDAQAAREEISSNELRVRQAQRELDGYEAKVGWDAKKSSLDQAQSAYDSKAYSLEQARRRKPELENIIGNCVQERKRLADVVNQKTARLNQLNNQMASLKKQLEPYHAEKARLESDIQAAQSRLTSLSSRFDSSIPN